MTESSNAGAAQHLQSVQLSPSPSPQLLVVDPATSDCSTSFLPSSQSGSALSDNSNPALQHASPSKANLCANKCKEDRADGHARTSSALEFAYVNMHSPPVLERTESQTARQVPTRARTLPGTSSRPMFLQGLSLADTPQAIIPRSRSSSPSSSESASSSPLPSPSRAAQDPNAGASSSSGVSRKVAESLQLFKETASTPTEESSHFSFDRRASLSKKRKPSRASLFRNVEEDEDADLGDTEPEFEFVKRSQWPDRESAALRREKSSVALERIRTRESKSSASGFRDRGSVDAADNAEMLYESPAESRGAAWQSDPSMSPVRGRPIKRPSWKEVASPLAADSEASVRPELPESSGSSSSVRTFLERRRSPELQPTTQNEQSVKAIVSSLSPSFSKRPSASPLTSSNLAHTLPPSDNLQVDGASATRQQSSIAIPIDLAQVETVFSTPTQSVTTHPALRHRQQSNAPSITSVPSAPTPSPTPFFTDDDGFSADDPDFDFDSEWDTGSVTTNASTHTSPPLSSPDISPAHLPRVGGVPYQQPMVALGDEDYMGLGRVGLQSPDRTRTFSHGGALVPRNTAHTGVVMNDGDETGVRKRQQAFQHGRSDSEFGTYDADDLGLNDYLPHIPLRPFRNQVGGHSAIYKFTKRAVCKVSNFSFTCNYSKSAYFPGFALPLWAFGI